jgi:hypothetical protein
MNHFYLPRLMPPATGRPAAPYSRREGNRPNVGLFDRRIACLHDELGRTAAVGLHAGIAYIGPVRIRFQSRGCESAGYQPSRAFVRGSPVRIA